jgi:hypothetical protein
MLYRGRAAKSLCKKVFKESGHGSSCESRAREGKNAVRHFPMRNCKFFSATPLHGSLLLL